MKHLKCKLTSSKKIEFNDSVLPASFPFILKGFSYTFEVNPTNEFWRLGLRFSKNANIEFRHPASRHYKSDDMFDLVLSAGELNGGAVDHVSRLQFGQYNIEDLNPILERLLNYKPKTKVKINLILKDDTIWVTISYGKYKSEFPIVISNVSEFVFFEVFAWADFNIYQIDLDLKIEDLNPYVDSFIVGSLFFRQGDMYDYDARTATNTVIFPASSRGSATQSIINKATDLGLPFPSKKDAGSVQIHHIGSDFFKHAGYAYSVDGYASTRDIIEEICSRLIAESQEKNLSFNLPLLGCGAGGLKSQEVADIYSKTLGVSSLVHCVNILTNEDFESVKSLFIGHYSVRKQNIQPKPPLLLEFERQTEIAIDFRDFLVDNKGEIRSLTIRNARVQDANLELLGGISGIIQLSFVSCQINSLEQLSKIIGLIDLSFEECKVRSFDVLNQLKKIKGLEFFNCEIDPRCFQKLSQLTFLKIDKCRLSNIDFLSKHKEIETLDLRRNKISRINSIAKLKKLKNLNLSNNEVVDLSSLSNLNQLRILNIAFNKVRNLSPLKSLFLDLFQAHNNPLDETYISLQVGENHAFSLKNYFYKLHSGENLIEIKKTIKVVLIGNHASGKSTLLRYLLSGKIQKGESTHLLDIKIKQDSNMPEIVFYDFGGQDYYHGVYQTFMSDGAIFLLLFENRTNHNKIRLDSTGILTRDFSVNYWLHQKKYLENERWGSENPNNLLLIQTYSETDGSVKSFIKGDYNEFGIVNDFYVDFFTQEGSSNGYLLRYLREYILSFINSKKTAIKIPKWNVEFLEFIHKKASEDDEFESTSLDVIIKEYKRPKIEGESTIDFLKEDLDQLHKQGVILYYKDLMPDVAWLNPKAFAKYVHEGILGKDNVNKGKLNVQGISSLDANVVKLLLAQNVIFKVSNDADEQYIIPSYLELANQSQHNFELLSFGLDKPSFILKFSCFIPQMMINKLIHVFGKNDYASEFWRDQIIFSDKRQFKAGVFIDYEKMEVRAYFVTSNKAEIPKIKRYLFYTILSAYWEFDVLTYDDFFNYRDGKIEKENFSESDPMFVKIDAFERIYGSENCRPVDLHISLDGSNYVNYNELCNIQTTQTHLRSFLIISDQIVDATTNVPAFLFESFTNKQLRRRKKVAISYSKRDIKLVNKFRQYLIPLFEDGLIESWYCSELSAGQEWDEEIQKRFDDADIICFMMSENLFSTKYVLENEIRKSIERWDRDKSIKIIPILLVSYPWKRNNREYDLSRFCALPYAGVSIVDGPNQNMMWNYVSRCLRVAIENDLDTSSNLEFETFDSELKVIQEKIISKRDN